MTKREKVRLKYGGKCAYTGKDLDDDWQVDHVFPRIGGGDNNISNLAPCIAIVNHYKREKTLEQFRTYMLSFHLRLKKLPKKTIVYETEKRIKYMNKVANLFDITHDKPFSGKFYFETLNQDYEPD